MSKTVLGMTLLMGLYASSGYCEQKDAPNGEEILTLEECIARGIANYQGIKAAGFDEIWAEAKLSEAKRSRFVPHLVANNLFGAVPNLPEGYGPPNFSTWSIDWSEWNVFYRIKIEGTQPLYTFGKLSNLIDAAESGVKAKELQVEIEKQELIHKIKSLYWGLVFGYSSLGLLDEVDEKVESAKKRVSKLLARHSSEVTDLDFLKLKVFDTEFQKRYIDVKSDINTGKKALMVLMGKPPVSGIDVKDRILVQMKTDIKDAQRYFTEAMEGRPELKQIKAAVEIKRAMLGVSKSDFLPTLFLAGQLDYGVAPGRAEYNNPYISDRFNVFQGGGALGLTQNLNFFLTSTKYRQAKAEYNKLLEQSKMVENAVFLEVRDSYQDLVSYNEGVEVTRGGFKDARSWMTSSYLSFDMGTLPTKDLIESFVAYTKTKMDFLNTIFSFNMALSKLSRATGVEQSELKY